MLSFPLVKPTPLRFGTEGFRGVIAKDLTFATLHHLAEGFALTMVGHQYVCVFFLTGPSRHAGRQGRPHGPQGICDH